MLSARRSAFHYGVMVKSSPAQTVCLYLFIWVRGDLPPAISWADVKKTQTRRRESAQKASSEGLKHGSP